MGAPVIARICPGWVSALGPPGIPTCRSPPPVYFYLSLLVWEPLTPHPLCPGPGSSARQVGFPPGEVGIVGTALAAVAGGAESSWSVCSFYLISFAQRQYVRALMVCISLRFSLNWKSQRKMLRAGDGPVVATGSCLVATCRAQEGL